MNVFLLARDQDFTGEQALPAHADALVQDLELDTVFQAMAQGDDVIRQVVPHIVLGSLMDVDTIRYRQAVLEDCLRHPEIVRQIYELAGSTLQAEKKIYWGLFSHYPSAILHRSIDVLELCVASLQKLRALADTHAGQFRSEGFTRFFGMLHEELSDTYFTTLQEHLRQLRFPHGVLVSFDLGPGNKGIHPVLRRPLGLPAHWWQRLATKRLPAYSFSIHERDEAGARALSEIRDRGINLVANALAQSTDHILGFFDRVRRELAFYLGCVHLHRELQTIGLPVTFPDPTAPATSLHHFVDLYDTALALRTRGHVVGNTVDADGKTLIIITGANRGGKSTFLRSLGLAQLMAQCGMFVPASSFTASVANGIYTHFKREEDPSLHSGKLDEELRRMSALADHMAAHALILFNESFSATNEREGAEIAWQITEALIEREVKVAFVTHSYEFARRFYEAQRNDVLFLRADRQEDGTRTFKLIEARPLSTSFGRDLYVRIFDSHP
jgi:hypothetical protein